MAKEIFKIAESSNLGNGINAVGEKSKVTEKYFIELLESKVKDLTKDNPDKYEETLQKAKEFIYQQKSLTVEDTWFSYVRKY